MLSRAKLLSLAVLVVLAFTQSARAATIDMKPVRATDPWMVIPLPNGNVLYIDKLALEWRIAPDGPLSSQYTWVFGPSPGATSDPTGIVWGTGPSAQQPIARLDTQGQFTYTDPLPSGNVPYRLAWGPDNALWFSEYTQFPYAAIDKIGRRGSDGTVTEYNVTAGAKPSTIMSGPDGNLWFEEPGINSVGRITPKGAIAEFPLPAGVTLVDGRSREMAVGPGGDLYIVVAGGIARMTTSGIVTGVITGGLKDFAPNAVAYGHDGNLWATECALNTVARISPSGTVTRAPEGTFPAKACPMGMVTATDGTPWLYEWNTGRAGRIVFSSPLASTDDGSDVTPNSAALNGTASPRGVATTVHFEYGTTTAYGRSTPEQAIGDGDDSVSVTAAPGNLQPSTTYHYRLVATSVIGTVAGADITVTTRPTPPPPAPPIPADTDGDGFNVNVDCDDLSAKIHPGAPDRPGDGVDEDCSGSDAPYQRFQPHAEAGWKTSHGTIAFTRLTIDEMPAGSSLSLSCSGPGCKISGYSASISKPVRRLDVSERLKKARLRKGAVVELRLSRPGYITTITRWTIGPPPKATILCLPPGAKKPGAC